MWTKVALEDVRPNPFRDLEADPLDPSTVAAILESLHDSGGLWQCLRGRRVRDGTVEVAFGHHRLEAARQAGSPNWIWIDVRELTDTAMVHEMVSENAARRTGSSNALEACAAVTKLMLTALLTDDADVIPDNRMRAQLLGQITGKPGLGATAVYEHILTHVDALPGVNPNSIRMAMAELKNSGRYLGLPSR